MVGYRRKLDDRVCRILFSGAGQSHRFVSIFDGATEDNPRGHHAGRFFDFFGLLPQRAVPMELPGGVWIHRVRSLFYVL